ncbi:MAG: B12-binding domain-containing radical SAM protein [Chloroflexi bacterium]|nr:B12-binding domain-containing radical SAM protein [Chloroflexota bacterium]
MATIAGQIDNHDVWIADMSVWRKKAVPRFVQALKDLRPQVVGFTAMTFQYESALEFAWLTKQFDPTIKTVLGGYHATLFCEDIAASPDAALWDFLFRGEGDFGFGELLDSIEADGKGMNAILGLSYKEDERFYHNGPRPLEDISKIRIPARDKRIAKGFHMYFRRADVIETSRGCLHLCNFCSIREMYGRSFRLFPLDRVLADIEDAYSRGARHIFCTDDNITLDMDRFEQLCDGVIGLKLKNLVFTTQASPIGFAHRPGIGKKMAEAGFVSIFLGIENASTKNLKAMHKPNTLETIRRGVQELQNANISVIAGIINGLEGDDPASMRENYEFIKGMGITSVMDQLMTPYPKTPLRGEMLQSGRVANMGDFRWYDGYFSNVRTQALTPAELGFHRWKIRREVIGMWRPTAGDWRHFKGYTYLWQFGLRYLVWLNERLLTLLFGHEGRYKLQMRHFLQLNDLGIRIPGRKRAYTYHPLYGTAEDPYQDTRWTLLKKRLPLLLGDREEAAIPS